MPANDRYTFHTTTTAVPNNTPDLCAVVDYDGETGQFALTPIVAWTIIIVIPPPGPDANRYFPRSEATPVLLDPPTYHGTPITFDRRTGVWRDSDSGECMRGAASLSAHLRAGRPNDMRDYLSDPDSDHLPA